MPRQIKSPVIFTGENPGLSLFRPGSGELVAAAYTAFAETGVALVRSDLVA